MEKHIFHRFFILLTSAILAYCSGCDRHSDEGQAEAQTYATLKFYGDTLVEIQQAGVDVSQFKSANDFLDYCERNDIITKGERNRSEKDSWGNRFLWETYRSDDGEIVVQVLSNGRNGVLDEGVGDDMFLRVRIHKDKSMGVFMKPIQK
jgi:hypothetical protein